MTQELTALQAQYIAGVETMNKDDVTRFLALLEADYGAEYREQRITALTRHLRSIERIAHAEQRKKDEHAALMASSRKFRVITDGWIANGAEQSQVADGYAYAWTYEGRELYRMYGALSGLGKHIDEVLADVQRIDVEFQELLRKGANT